MISGYLQRLTGLIPRGQPVALLDYPVYANPGDLMILLGTAVFLRANRNRVTQAGNYSNGLRQLRQVPEGRTILLQGGGNLGDRYPKHERFRRAVIGSRHGNPIVVLPQTLDFSDAAELAESGRIYRAHPDLVVCVRDRISERIAREHLCDRVVLLPDMAHALRVRPVVTGSGDLVLLRRDAEQVSAVPADGYDRNIAVDWQDIMGPVALRMIGILKVIHRRDGRRRTGLPLYRMTLYVAWRVVNDLRRRFAPYERIVTSRLHGHILGCLMGKRVLLLDNSYGKNRSYYDAWTSRLDTVRFDDPAARASLG